MHSILTENVHFSKHSVKFYISSSVLKMARLKIVSIYDICNDISMILMLLKDCWWRLTSVQLNTVWDVFCWISPLKHVSILSYFVWFAILVFSLFVFSCSSWCRIMYKNDVCRWQFKYLELQQENVGSSSIAFVCSSLVYPFSKMHCHIFVPTL